MKRTRRYFLRMLGAASPAGFATRPGNGGVRSRDTVPPFDEESSERNSEAGVEPLATGASSATPTPPVEEIPEGGIGENFELVGHAPLSDDHQYVGDESLGVPRGSNGDITITGDTVYVGSFIGYQPPLIVDVEDPTDPEVVGPVPDAVPGVANGIEGIEASGDVLIVDQREPIDDMGFDVPEGEPGRSLSVYDVSDPHVPELVSRFDYGGLQTHTVSLWRDPADPERLLAVQSFNDVPNVAVLDLTGCPDDCEPTVVAEWALETQTGIEEHTHEAITSTDGRRIYVAQYRGGVFLIDSSALIDALRNDEACDPSMPASTPGDEHCLTMLNPESDGRMDPAPPFDVEWQHTALKVPDRSYLFVTAESPGPTWVAEDQTVDVAPCPGAFTRLVYVGEDETMRGDLSPEIVGIFGLPEQDLANCDYPDWGPDGAAPPAWLSPHNAVVFPDVAFATYYSAGLRAIDISDPTAPVEAGYFFNDPVETVRWASHGIRGELEYDADGTPLRRPLPATHMFAFSYPVVHDGYVIYADTHSGLYVLEYDGPHADQIPDDGNCVSGNPGAVEPGYEPCPPYGATDWE